MSETAEMRHIEPGDLPPLTRAQRDELEAKWRPWEGTPETKERIDRVPRHRRDWPLDRMAAMGKITTDERAAGEEISLVIEWIESQVSVGVASLEARVDHSGSSRGALIESLGRIRLEKTYEIWRRSIPKPARMILDMLSTNQSYVGQARKYRLPYRTARKRLISALRLWMKLREEVAGTVAESDALAVYARLGEGVLLPPKPKRRRVEADDE